MGLPSGAWWHWCLCLSCAMAEAIDPNCRSPFSPFPIRFTILVLAWIWGIQETLLCCRSGRRWHWLVFCWCLGFLHIFIVLTINVYVQLGLLIVKCLLDYTYLSRQTNIPIASAFKTVVIIVLLIFVCLLWKKLWARVLIVSVMDRLDLAGIEVVQLTATLFELYISMWCYSKFVWGRTMKIVNGC